MPKTPPPLPLGALMLVTLGLIGCTAAGALVGAPSADEGGCSPQVAAGYRIQTDTPVGILEIHVEDASGSPVASASVTAIRLVYTGYRCRSLVNATTDAQGVARLERMKTGPYEVDLENLSATASATLEADKTVSVTLKKAP